MGCGWAVTVNESGKTNGSKWVLNESDCLSHHDGQDTLLMVCSRKLWCLDACGTHLRMGITWNYWTLAVTQSNEWAIQMVISEAMNFNFLMAHFMVLGSFLGEKNWFSSVFHLSNVFILAENSSRLQNQKSKGIAPKYKKALFSIIYTRHNPK